MLKEVSLYNNCTDSNEEIALLKVFEDVTRRINSVSIGRVVTVNNDQTVDVSIIYSNNGVEYPVLRKAPLLVLQGDGKYIKFPVAQGDMCLLLFCDKDISAWHITGEERQTLSSQRKHDLSDVIAICGVNYKEATGLGKDNYKNGDTGESPIQINGNGNHFVKYNELKQILETFNKKLKTYLESGTATGDFKGTINPGTTAAAPKEETLSGATVSFNGTYPKFSELDLESIRTNGIETKSDEERNLGEERRFLTKGEFISLIIELKIILRKAGEDADWLDELYKMDLEIIIVTNLSEETKEKYKNIGAFFDDKTNCIYFHTDFHTFFDKKTSETRTEIIKHDSTNGKAILLHELRHAWQYQNSDWIEKYIDKDIDIELDTFKIQFIFERESNAYYIGNTRNIFEGSDGDYLKTLGLWRYANYGNIENGYTNTYKSLYHYIDERNDVTNEFYSYKHIKNYTFHKYEDIKKEYEDWKDHAKPTIYRKILIKDVNLAKKLRSLGIPSERIKKIIPNLSLEEIETL